jgi:serine/threonine protein kinase
MTLSPVGTVGYMAPEVLDKTLVAYSKQSDVYSFGILLLELASGRSAWEGKTEQHIEQMILKGYIPQSLASFTGTLIHQLVFSCLTKDPNNRPSFPEILEKLQQDSIADPFV